MDVQRHICPAEDTILIAFNSFSFVISHSGFNNQGALRRTLYCWANYSASLCTPIHIHLNGHNAVAQFSVPILKHSCFWRGLFTSSVSFLSFEAESLWKLIVESLERHQRRGAVLSGWHFQPVPFRKLPALKRPWPQAFGLHRG